MSPLKQTPLNAKHREAHAKLVDFSGWEMPLHYGSQVEEHHVVRRDAGMFDVSHMRVVDVRGEAARPFLSQLIANNVDKLQSTGNALYSFMLHAGGGVIDDLIVYYQSESWFRIVINAGCADKDIAWMLQQRDALAPGLEITPRADLAMIAVQGPAAAARLWTAMPGLEGVAGVLKPFFGAMVGDMFVARTGYTGEDGFEIMLPAKAAPFFWQALLEAGVKPCGLGARDTLRLEAGMALYGQDMDETITPFEAGLAWTVDMQGERDFIGKRSLQALPRNRQMVGLKLIDRGVLRAHQMIETEHGGGEITSGGFSPTLNASIALARVPSGVQPGDRVEVMIRDRGHQAEVVKYPFVRNGRALI